MKGYDNEGADDEYYYGVDWLLQTYGFRCPSEFASSVSLLSPEATALLFALRLFFLCVGVYVGESLCFVALTGGIATGKSTVGRLLINHEYNSPKATSTRNKNANRKKPKNSAGFQKDEVKATDDRQEATVNLICSDMIAHQILLPPSVLELGRDREEEDDHEDTEDRDSKKAFIVSPTDSVYPRVVSAFEGQDILAENGKIDRLKLGAIVFNNPEKRRTLNRITHPAIFVVLLKLLVKSVLFGKCNLTIADIPLLFESGQLSWIFAVTACVSIQDPSVQLTRLQKRNPELSMEECRARIESQLPLEKKVKMADLVVDNSGDFEELKLQVEELRRELMGRCYGIGMSLLQMILLIGGSTSIAVTSKYYSGSY
eukprot:Nitzschia sp. Nitz4//scaffold124_size66437//17060//18175//NITZ4_006106-RA/size66437-processed-gene-0.38-mRNA-1//1//CDS//3329534537//4607//frame0